MESNESSSDQGKKSGASSGKGISPTEFTVDLVLNAFQSLSVFLSHTPDATSSAMTNGSDAAIQVVTAVKEIVPAAVTTVTEVSMNCGNSVCDAVAGVAGAAISSIDVCGLAGDLASGVGHGAAIVTGNAIDAAGAVLGTLGEFSS